MGNDLTQQLRTTPFIPIMRKGEQLSHIAPGKCYFGSSSTYDQIFDFVDFGETANAFLLKCGARSQPTMLEVAEMACSEPNRLLGILESPDKYLSLLRQFADSVATLRKDVDLWAKMKSSPFLIGYKETPKPQGLVDTDDNSDDAPVVREYQLCAAKNIVVADDYVSYRFFKDSLMCAPEEDALETFYTALGAPPLSSLVSQHLEPGPRYVKQDLAVRKRKFILERTKLFLYEFSKYNANAVKYNAKWLEQSMVVEVVNSILLHRSLRGRPKSHTEKRYAASTKSKGCWILYIAHDKQDDMYQVGQAICHMVLRRPSQQAFLFFEPFLVLNLLQLRDRGYNVDRILRARAVEAKIAAEEQRQAAAGDAAGHQEQPTSTNPVMPGSFTGDKPPSSNGHMGSDDSTLKINKRFWSLVSKSLSTKWTHRGQERISNSLGDGRSDAHPSGSGASSNFVNDDDDEEYRIHDARTLRKTLTNAIKASQPYVGSDLVSRSQEIPEETNLSSYCQMMKVKDLVYRADVHSSMKVYVGKAVPVQEATQFLQRHTNEIKCFVKLLTEVAVGIYGLQAAMVHVFWDVKGSTIAFNIDGAIFCNLKKFLDSQAGKMMGGQGQGQGGIDEARAECVVFWFVVIAHELAHNIVKAHGARHSFYT